MKSWNSIFTYENLTTNINYLCVTTAGGHYNKSWFYFTSIKYLPQFMYCSIYHIILIEIRPKINFIPVVWNEFNVLSGKWNNICEVGLKKDLLISVLDEFMVWSNIGIQLLQLMLASEKIIKNIWRLNIKYWKRVLNSWFPLEKQNKKNITQK